MRGRRVRTGLAVTSVTVLVPSGRPLATCPAARWSSAQAALQNLHEHASQLDGAFEEHFDAVGGGVQDFNAARNSLHADLAEGDIAAGAKNSRALSDVAHRITLIAGELAQPLADAHDASVALKVDAAMFHARRMLDALVRGDALG